MSDTTPAARRVTLDPRIALRFGEAAAERLREPVTKLVEHGPLAWLETDAGPLRRRRLVLVRGKWVAYENLDILRAALRAAKPPLEDWQPIVKAHESATADHPLLDRESLSDLADPRFQTFPIGKGVLDAWHAPAMVEGALEYFVELFPHRAEVVRVRVDGKYQVTIDYLPRG